jgi:acylphosphatase
MEVEVRLTAVVSGHVQGVCFRYFVQSKAIELGLKGYVQNLPGGNAIEVQAEGNRNRLESLIARLQIGPPGATINHLEIYWSNKLKHFREFTIKY